jgi:hypothetical protein
MLTFDAIRGTADLITVLNRHIDVRVLEVSAGGCLLEAAFDVPVGTLGLLSLEANGSEYADSIRVTRSQLIPGAGERRLIGAEFVWLTQPGERSVRRLARIVGREGEPAGVTSISTVLPDREGSNDRASGGTAADADSVDCATGSP